MKKTADHQQAGKGHAGLWIDHKGAFVVFIKDEGEETRRIESGVEKHVRFSGRSASEEGSADDQRDRQFTQHLNQYYDEVISTIGKANAVLLLGPGEAKGELLKRMVKHGLHGRIVKIETSDKMTEPQIVAKVREHFHK